MTIDWQVLGWIAVPCLIGFLLAILIYYLIHDMLRDQLCKHPKVVRYRGEAYCSTCSARFGSADAWESRTGRVAETKRLV